jgi:hypothetical protein
MRVGGFQLLVLCAVAKTSSTTPSHFPFRVRFDISDARYESSFVVKVHPLWAPIGALRFRELVDARFYDNTRFFRVRPGFMVSFACRAPALLLYDTTHSSLWLGLAQGAIRLEWHARGVRLRVNLRQQSLYCFFLCNRSKQWLDKKIRDDPVKKATSTTRL